MANQIGKHSHSESEHDNYYEYDTDFMSDINLKYLYANLPEDIIEKDIIEKKQKEKEDIKRDILLNHLFDDIIEDSKQHKTDIAVQPITIKLPFYGEPCIDITPDTVEIKPAFKIPIDVDIQTLYISSIEIKKINENYVYITDQTSTKKLRTGQLDIINVSAEYNAEEKIKFNDQATIFNIFSNICTPTTCHLSHLTRKIFKYSIDIRNIINNIGKTCNLFALINIYVLFHRRALNVQSIRSIQQNFINHNIHNFSKEQIHLFEKITYEQLCKNIDRLISMYPTDTETILTNLKYFIKMYAYVFNTNRDLNLMTKLTYYICRSVNRIEYNLNLLYYYAAGEICECKKNIQTIDSIQITFDLGKNTKKIHDAFETYTAAINMSYHYMCEFQQILIKDKYVLTDELTKTIVANISGYINKIYAIIYSTPQQLKSFESVKTDIKTILLKHLTAIKLAKNNTPPI